MSDLEEMESIMQKKLKQAKFKSEYNNLITVSVIFGMPTKNCSYQGICRIEPGENYQENSGKCIGIAELFKIDEHWIAFSFPKANLDPKTIRKHFGSGYFIILEDYQAPEFLYNAIGKTPFVIQQGIYKVKENENYYKVEINVSN